MSLWRSYDEPPPSEGRDHHPRPGFCAAAIPVPNHEHVDCNGGKVHLVGSARAVASTGLVLLSFLRGTKRAGKELRHRTHLRHEPRSLHILKTSPNHKLLH